MASTAPTTEPYPSNMPLTPRDSDNEEPEPSEPSQMAGRKRSASEMEEEGGKSKTNIGNGEEAAETIEADFSPDFTIQCPAPKRAQKPGADVYVEHDAPSLAPNLGIDFTVRPGSTWSNLSRFKNAKFKDPFVVIYSAGQIVYVNRHSPVPPSPSAEATEDERLQYDKDNFWVGLISEFRAENQEKVYVRVFWLYWPDELPMGRQPYHGKRELVLSNHVDIIEAQTIASHAEVSRWDENDDSNKTVLQERYWRQTYDLKKASSDPRNALSKLRKFCICGGYDNPGLDMYQCHRVGCGLWNHEACLKADVEKRAWAQFKNGTLGDEVQRTDDSKTFTQKLTDAFGQIVDRGLGKDRLKDDAESDVVSITKGSKKTKVKSPGDGKKPWKGKLEAEVFKTQKGDGDGDGEESHSVIVKQLVPTANSKPTSQFEPKTWTMKMGCLRCGQPLN